MPKERKGKQQPDENRAIIGSNVDEDREEENPWRVREKVVEGYIDEDQEEENPWRIREKVVEGYIDEDQEEENPWHIRENMVEGYIDKQNEGQKDEKQRYAGKSFYDRDEEEDKYPPPIKKIVDSEGQLDEEGNEGQPAVANLQSRLASHFKFIRQGGNHFRDFMTPVKEQSQRPSRVSFMARLPDQYKEFVAAACFLSILPFPGNAQAFVSSEESEPKLVIGSAYFPLVGLMIAVIAYLVLVIGFALHLPPLVLAAVLIIALVWLTGGLHLDGLMDTCDGLFDRGTRERKLEIMHDSRSGAFGVLGGVCILLLKFAIFASLDLHHLVQALLIVLPLARWSMVLAMYIFPSALLTGLGAAARRTITRPHIFIAGITSLLIALIVGQLIGLAIWMGGSLVTLIIGIWVTYILEGLTGDIYGAIAETTEVIGLLVLVAVR